MKRFFKTMCLQEWDINKPEHRKLIQYIISEYVQLRRHFVPVLKNLQSRQEDTRHEKITPKTIIQ